MSFTLFRCSYVRKPKDWKIISSIGTSREDVCDLDKVVPEIFPETVVLVFRPRSKVYDVANSTTMTYVSGIRTVHCCRLDVWILLLSFACGRVFSQSCAVTRSVSEYIFYSSTQCGGRSCEATTSIGFTRRRF